MRMIIVDNSGSTTSHISENKDILVNEMINKLGITKEDLENINPNELKALIRENKINQIL